MVFQRSQKILFQGDSITDAGRSREDAKGLGGGYAMMAASQMQALHPGLRLTFINSNYSGRLT